LHSSFPPLDLIPDNLLIPDFVTSTKGASASALGSFQLAIKNGRKFLSSQPIMRKAKQTSDFWFAAGWPNSQAQEDLLFEAPRILNKTLDVSVGNRYVNSDR